MTLDDLQALSDDQLAEALATCCVAQAWVQGLLARRPFASQEALWAAATEVEAQMTRADWLEAFSGHPRIGDVASLRAKYAHTAAWASGEQSGAAAATEEVLQGLAQGNQDYEAKFGHIFIVCATGKSGAEMLALLQARLPNDPESELSIAAAEQAKISRIRLEKLLAA